MQAFRSHNISPWPLLVFIFPDVQGEVCNSRNSPTNWSIFPLQTDFDLNRTKWRIHTERLFWPPCSAGMRDIWLLVLPFFAAWQGIQYNKSESSNGRRPLCYFSSYHFIEDYVGMHSANHRFSSMRHFLVKQNFWLITCDACMQQEKLLRLLEMYLKSRKWKEKVGSQFLWLKEQW